MHKSIALSPGHSQFSQKTAVQWLHAEKICHFSACNIEKLGVAWGYYKAIPSTTLLSQQHRKNTEVALSCPNGVSLNTCTHWVQKEEKFSHSCTDIEGIE